VAPRGRNIWGTLKEDYAVCGSGSQQSPINIQTAHATEGDVGSIKFDYKQSPLKIVNNSHTIQVNYAAGSSITVGGEQYQLLQLHFHTPSEHTINGKASPMELHLVHKSGGGALAVVGIMLDETGVNKTLQPIWDNLPQHLNKEAEVQGMTIDASALLPK
jgi:carbonic anhydrase